MCVSERIIYTLNAKNNMMLSLIKSDFSLSDEKVHEIIISEYQKMIIKLNPTHLMKLTTVSPSTHYSLNLFQESN